MKNKNHLLWWIWGILTIAIPVILAWILWEKLPIKIPVHWNFYGEADSYMPKAQAIAVFSAINVVLYALLWLLPIIDPKRNFSQFKTSYHWLTFSLATFFCGLTSIIIIHSAGTAFHLFKAIMAIVLLMFLVMGNFMGKLRPNYFVGIRTPWTIENDEVWVKTHRLAGRLWVITATIALALMATVHAPSWIFAATLLIVVFVPLIYSYIIYKQLKED